MTYRPIKHHGIRLAAGSFLHNAVFEPLATDPTGAELVPGRFWYNTTENVNKFTTSDGSGGVIVNVSTTQAAVTQVSDKVGNLANLVTTNKSSLVTAINELRGSVNSIGNAFNYVSVLDGGASEVAPFNLSGLTEKDTGDYYKVNTTGWFIVGAGDPFLASVGDGLVWNTTGTVDIIDNTQASVAGTVGDIDITGTVDVGFVAKLSDDFKGRVSAVEGKAASTISAVGLNPDGTYTAPVGANYIDSDESVKAALVTLDQAVQAEFDRAIAAEGDLTLLQTDETENLVAAINELVEKQGQTQNTLGGSVSELINTIGALDEDGSYIPHTEGDDGGTHYIHAATTVREESVILDGKVKQVETSVGSLDDITAYNTITHGNATPVTSLSEAIIAAAEIARASSSDVYAQLEMTHVQINESYVTFKSTAPASSFEITHNFGTNTGAEFLTVDVWVKDINGGFTRYYNDIVSIEETTPDVITITASSDIEIKAIIHAVKPIGMGG